MSNLHDSALLSCINGLPNFESLSALNNLPNLGDFDIDEHLPQSIQSQYYTVSELASLDIKAQDLSIFHTNIRSLSRHHDELISLLQASKKSFDVIGVSEMWHGENNPILTNINIDDYNFYNLKSLSQNGGVGLYVKASLISSIRNDLNSNCENFETICVEIELKNEKNLLICCAYRHPNSAIENFTNHLLNILSKVVNKRVFIMGDFNVNLLNYASHTPTNDFVNVFFSKNFLPCINYPTRIYGQSSTIIDNIFTNMIDSKIICGNILTHISEHFPQFLILGNANICYNCQDTLMYDYSTFNERNFINDFSKIDFNYLNYGSDVNSSYNKFLDDVTSLVSKHIPNIKCSKRELKYRSKPWICNRIKKMMRIRDRLLRKWRHSKSESAFNVYKRFRNRVPNEIKKSKKNYFQNYFMENKNSMKKLWHGIKSIISNNSSYSSISKIKDKHGNLTSNPSEIPNVFNDFFVTVSNENYQIYTQN